MFSLAFSVPLATTFGVATVTAVVLLWRARSRAARFDQASKAAAGAASLGMVMPASIPMLFIAELVFFTAATTWFVARLGERDRSLTDDRMSSIVGHIHSIVMMAAMAVMAYQSLRMIAPSSGTQPVPAHAHQLAATSDPTLAVLVALAVLLASSSVLHHRASLPVGPASLGRWTAWSIGALESAGMLLLIVAMSV